MVPTQQLPAPFVYTVEESRPVSTATYKAPNRS
jgi:hypothetical protein